MPGCLRVSRRFSFCPLAIGREEIGALRAVETALPGLWRIVLDFREGGGIFRGDVKSTLSSAEGNGW